jgi:hypothetical protein
MKRKFLAALLLSFIVLAFSQSNALLVYATPKGEKYHLQNCRTIAKSKVVETLTIEEAKERGLEPCKVCKPGE